jgi:chemotaxis protein methyltransferase CheR
MINLSYDTLVRLTDYLKRHMGLSFPRKKWDELEGKISQSLAEFNFDDSEAFVDWLLSSAPPTRNQIEILASHLTVGETYFFREKQTFEILEERILGDLIKTRRQNERRLRIWSAGCCTGEEPYSIAIVLSKMLPDLKDWNVSILATDINPRFLHKASEGVYSKWSFRDCPQGMKEKYFRKAKGDRLEILPDIKKMVTFSYLNLVEDSYPSLSNSTNAMDVIFCRNVLMYFVPAQIDLTAGRFYRSLLEGGCLIVSPVETALLNHSPFLTVRFQDSTFYRKDFLKAKKGPGAAKNIGIESLPCPAPQKTAKQRRPEIPSRPTRQAELKKSKVAERTSYEEAAILYRNGLYPEAEDRLRKLISNGGRNQESCILFARVLANQGKLEEAFGFCEEAVSADKCNPHLHYLLATILEEQKQVEEARVSLKKALYLDRNFVLAHFALANLSLRSGKVADARKHFGNVTEILSGYKPEDIIPESEGITAGRLVEIIKTFRSREMS